MPWLGDLGGIGWWMEVLIALAVLFSTHLSATDTAARNMADAVWKIEKVREVLRNDIRYVYYIILISILAWSSLALFLKPSDTASDSSNIF